MKSVKQTLLITFLLVTVTVFGQAWQKNTKVLAIGAGGSTFFHLYQNSNAFYGYRGWNTPLTGQFNFQGEFGVHDYVGIGFTTGIGGRPGYGWGGYSGYGGELTVPVGIIANFHFYQLIADKTGKDIHSDKLDIYGGANVGSGIAALFYRNNNGTGIIPIAFGGVQAGARYYFTEKFGVNLEVGYGKSFINGGVVLKL